LPTADLKAVAVNRELIMPASRQKAVRQAAYLITAVGCPRKRVRLRLAQAANAACPPPT